jgi:hypothetical protein
LTFDAFGERLGAMLRTRADRAIFLNPDPDLLFNEIVQGAGASRIGLMTTNL